MVGCCEHVNESSGSIKGEGIFDFLNDCWLPDEVASQ
jgi:hypothetical protein